MIGLDLQPVSTLFNVGTANGLSDCELLERFRGDSRAASEAAFAALVARHGPMVMGVCRRVLADPDDVDDAFQATFLVLVRKAGSVRVSDSLGRWLYGVSRKVASRSRLEATRRPAVAGDSADSWQARPSPETELAEALDEEIDRLPHRYREAVRMCYLEGLALREAAELIGCPIGTVGSRLSRARDLLKSRLGRRGLATSTVAVASWLEARQARAAVSASLVAKVTGAAAQHPAGTVPASVGILVTAILRGFTMMKIGISVGLFFAVGLGSIGAAMIIAPPEQSTPAQPPVRGDTGGQPPIKAPSRDDRVRAILNEFRAAQKVHSAVVAKAATEKEQLEALKLLPDTVQFTDRLLVLAEEQPADSAARQAAIWIVEQSVHHNEVGSWGAQVKRAMDLLLEHHADSPEVGRLCLVIEMHISRNRLPFLEGLLARTKNREVRGLATYSLGEYLAVEAETIESLRTKESATMKFFGGGGRLDIDVGKSAAVHREIADYFTTLKQQDSAVVRARAIRLLNDVIEHYADLPDTRVSRINPAPHEPARVITLGAAAATALHEIQDLREGMVAPAFEGTDLSGVPVKLADYRGKVVLMVFWASWCGECIREAPHERELAKKLEGRPFTILGVNIDGTREDALKVITAQKMSWRHVFDGAPGTGKAFGLYNVQAVPTAYLLDEAGVIRARGDLQGQRLDDLVEKLVKALEAKTARFDGKDGRS